MTRSTRSTTSTQVERRFIIRLAARELGERAKSSIFVPSYARMNPAANLPANAFFFGSPGRSPRVVIIGPWVYVHAPHAKLPKGVEHISDSMRTRKHLGALHARVLLDSQEALAILRKVARSLRRSVE